MKNVTACYPLWSGNDFSQQASPTVRSHVDRRGFVSSRLRALAARLNMEVTNEAHWVLLRGRVSNYSIRAGGFLVGIDEDIRASSFA